LEKQFPAAGRAQEIGHAENAAVEDRLVNIRGIDGSQGGEAPEALAAAPTKREQQPGVNFEGKVRVHFPVDLEQVEGEDSVAAIAPEAGLDGGPIDCRSVAALQKDEVLKGAERRPDSLSVGMLHLGVEDLVDHEMFRRGYAELHSADVQERRVSNDFGCGKELGEAAAGKRAVDFNKRRTLAP
jgi:hypothetical protein